MADNDMRGKAAAMFGKEFMGALKSTPAVDKNSAAALQKRANARPIPQYKVGGLIKKEPVTGGSKSVPKTPERADFERRLLEQQKATGQTPIKRAVGGRVKKDVEETSKALKAGLAKGPSIGESDATKRADEAVDMRRVEKGMEGMGKKQSFGEAFKAARSAGVKTFEYGGKKFTTDMAGEKKTPLRAPDRKAVKSAVAAPRPVEKKTEVSKFLAAPAKGAPVGIAAPSRPVPADYIAKQRAAREALTKPERKPQLVGVAPGAIKRYADGGTVSADRIAARLESGRKDGGKVGKYAAGGAGKKRKGMC